METYENARNKTKLKIKDAFWDLYLENNINKITINSITKAANIHRATFYLYYHDIYEVLEEIQEELLSSLYALDIEVKPEDEMIRYFVHTLFDEYDKHRKYLHTFLIDHRDPQFYEKYYNAFFSHFPNLFNQGMYNEKVNTINELTVNGLLVILLYFADNQVLDADETFYLLQGFLFDGVFKTIINLNGLEYLK